MERTATCSCGQLSVTVEGDPQMHGICSCLVCQKASGTPFSHTGYWPKAQVVSLSGNATVWRRISDSGRWMDTHFCPICGSAVYGYAEFDPHGINIAIGNFADPTFAPPQYAMWNRFKHSWIEFPEWCATNETQP
jgi:hypothetical protein